VSEALLDSSVLIPLLWRRHEFHHAAQHWFKNSRFSRNSGGGWATCAVTEAAFVRIVSNPAFSDSAVSPQEAMDLLEINLADPDHRYWKDDQGFLKTVYRVAAGIQGHRQVTDGYLLGLALRHNGRLVTLDRGITALVPKGAARGVVEVIGKS
jgi:toxin-antitoxin system PIN domain toxin